jgi:hypothetical protein
MKPRVLIIGLIFSDLSNLILGMERGTKSAHASNFPQTQIWRNTEWLCLIVIILGDLSVKLNEELVNIRTGGIKNTSNLMHDINVPGPKILTLLLLYPACNLSREEFNGTLRRSAFQCPPLKHKSFLRRCLIYVWIYMWESRVARLPHINSYID